MPRSIFRNIAGRNECLAGAGWFAISAVLGLTTDAAAQEVLLERLQNAEGPAQSAHTHPALTPISRSETSVSQSQDIIEALAGELIIPIDSTASERAYSNVTLGPYVDHDARFPNLVIDYSGGAASYDLGNGYNHSGTDFLLYPFPWHQMDEEMPRVIAARGGTIESIANDEPDRNCVWDESFSTPSNGLRIRHEDGSAGVYLHMRRGSLSHLSVGQTVSQGDVLGEIASSGISTLPHLHFELRDADGNIIDPFAGPQSQPESLWRHQPAYLQTDVLRVSTHSAPPEFSLDSCVQSTVNAREVFQPGDTVFASVTMRHQPIGGAASTVIAYTPDGNEIHRESASPYSGASRPVLTATVVDATLPAEAPAGTWRLRVLYDDKVYHGHFFVGEQPESTQVVSAVLPSSRSIMSGTTATAYMTVVNSGNEAAEACTVRPATLFDGRVGFQRTDPVTNAVAGNADTAFDIPQGGSQSLVVSITPDENSEGHSLDLPLAVQCANTDAAPRTIGVNSLRLSFGSDPVPDLIAVSATPTSDGILTLANESAAGAFAIAVANNGEAAPLTVQPVVSDPALPLTATICETDASTGACLTSRSASLEREFGAGETATYSIFIRAAGPVPFDPAQHRIAFEALDSDNVSRGATSIAVRTQ